jgi:hypothetical protein
MRRSAAAAAIVLVVAISSGCYPAAPPSAPPPSAPAPPSTAAVPTDAEALAIAKEQYQAYLSTFDSVAGDWGKNPEPLSDVTSGPALQEALTGAADFAQANARSTGTTKVSAVQLQSVVPTGGGYSITIYVCEDLSDIDVVDREGNSLVQASRDDTYAYEVTLLSEDLAASPLVNERTVWPEEGICA